MPLSGSHYPRDEAQRSSLLLTNLFRHLGFKYSKSWPTPGPLHMLFQLLGGLCVTSWLTPSLSDLLSSPLLALSGESYQSLGYLF